MKGPVLSGLRRQLAVWPILFGVLLAVGAAAVDLAGRPFA